MHFRARLRLWAFQEGLRSSVPERGCSGRRRQQTPRLRSLDLGRARRYRGFKASVVSPVSSSSAITAKRSHATLAPKRADGITPAADSFFDTSCRASTEPASGIKAVSRSASPHAPSHCRRGSRRPAPARSKDARRQRIPKPQSLTLVPWLPLLTFPRMSEYEVPSQAISGRSHLVENPKASENVPGAQSFPRGRRKRLRGGAPRMSLH